VHLAESGKTSTVMVAAIEDISDSPGIIRIPARTEEDFQKLHLGAESYIN
jgi:hypothetical protein